MKITNKFNLPAPLVTLANKEFYSKGKSQFSMTELLSPPRVRRLREMHNDWIEQDVSDMMWSILGSALHVVLERGQTEHHITEERLFCDIDGVTISGAIDLQHENNGGVTITDYKFTSAWAVMQEKAEWAEQLNGYKWLVEKVKGQKVTALQICAIIRDWSRHDKREGYPPAPIQVVQIPIWDNDKTEAFIRERVKLHQEAKALQTLEAKLPPCSDEERWMSETIYAVKREGRKTAIRVFKSLEEASELARKEKGYVETRKGEPRRCTGNFCGVSQWCDQWAAASDSQDADAERQ